MPDRRELVLPSHSPRPGLTLERMTRITIEVADDVAERLHAAAAGRGVATEQLLSEVAAAQFPPRRRLAFAAVGPSGSTRGAAQADELLAEGFGRD